MATITIRTDSELKNFFTLEMSHLQAIITILEKSFIRLVSKSSINLCFAILYHSILFLCL